MIALYWQDVKDVTCSHVIVGGKHIHTQAFALQRLSLDLMISPICAEIHGLTRLKLFSTYQVLADASFSYVASRLQHLEIRQVNSHVSCSQTVVWFDSQRKQRSASHIRLHFQSLVRIQHICSSKTCRLLFSLRCCQNSLQEVVSDSIFATKFVEISQ